MNEQIFILTGTSNTYEMIPTVVERMNNQIIQNYYIKSFDIKINEIGNKIVVTFYGKGIKK